jgi:hypothetical protein
VAATADAGKALPAVDVTVPVAVVVDVGVGVAVAEGRGVGVVDGVTVGVGVGGTRGLSSRVRTTLTLRAVGICSRAAIASCKSTTVV